MNHAYGTVNALTRDNVLVYEAIYQPSYRHVARRLAGPSAPSSYTWSTEAAAIAALERAAERDGASITVQAGKYPRGTRRMGAVLVVAQPAQVSQVSL